MVKDITVKRREILFKKVIEKGINIKTAKDFTLQEWNETFESNITKKSSLVGAKSLLNQIKENSKQVIEYHVEKRNISNKSYINFLEKETKVLFEKEVKVREFEPDFDISEQDLLIEPKLKEGSYNIAEIVDDNGKTFYIKYKNFTEFERQFDKILSSYSLKNPRISHITKTMKKTFIDKDFSEYLIAHDINF